MRRRILVAVGLLVVLAAGVLLLRGAGPGAVRPGPPDVVLILIDALRRDHVGTYGYELPTTPTIDRLGAGGVVFENAWSQASETYPCTSTMLTSRWFPLDIPSYDYQGIPGGEEWLSRLFR